MPNHSDKVLMTKIEQVARASFAYWRADMDRLGLKMDMGRTFEDMTSTEQEFAMGHARAIIEAMREPSEEMLAAKDERANPVIWDANCHYCGGPKENWNVMIDAALAEKP